MGVPLAYSLLAQMISKGKLQVAGVVYRPSAKAGICPSCTLLKSHSEFKGNKRGVCPQCEFGTHANICPNAFPLEFFSANKETSLNNMAIKHQIFELQCLSRCGKMVYLGFTGSRE